MPEPRHRFRRRSVIDAPAEQVWERVASVEGINHELMPYLRMVFPRRYRGRDIGDLESGLHVGRVWLLYGGFLPLDYDDLTIETLTPGRGFAERSAMLAMPVWHHDRTVQPLPDGRSEVIDDVGFTPRLPLRPVTPLLLRLLRHVFDHRHRRLVAHFR